MILLTPELLVLGLVLTMLIGITGYCTHKYSIKIVRGRKDREE